MDLLSTNITPIWTVWNLQNEKGERWRRMKGLLEESGESKKLKLKIYGLFGWRGEGGRVEGSRVV